MSGSLRETLERSGFEDAIRTNNGPDLDRKLTSSAFGTSPDTFVAGYYFEDELDGQGLGPLHVSLFDRSRREWAHKHNVETELKELARFGIGSVNGIVVSAQTVLLDTHLSPSAGLTIVMSRSLRVLSALYGYGARITKEGAVWYFGDMVHFADIHQETLKSFDLGTSAEVEIFPGARLSSIAEAYRRQIKEIYAKIQDNQHLDDFDRSIDSVIERNSMRFAFVVGYRSDYLDGSKVAHPTLSTIARCDRQSGGAWSCSERELEQFAREVGTTVSKNSYGGYDERMLKTLVEAALVREP